MTVASLARSDEEAREGAGLAPYCARYEMGRVRNPIQVVRMVATAAYTVAVVHGFLLLAASRATGRASCLAQERFDLIFVHCSSVAQYVDGRAR